MSKHTPGPWIVSKRPFMHAHTIDVVAGGREGHSVVVHDLPHGTHQEANARLIAAAPELLECLRAWLLSATAEKNKWLVENTQKLIAKAE